MMAGDSVGYYPLVGCPRVVFQQDISSGEDLKVFFEQHRQSLQEIATIPNIVAV